MNPANKPKGTLKGLLYITNVLFISPGSLGFVINLLRGQDCRFLALTSLISHRMGGFKGDGYKVER